MESMRLRLFFIQNPTFSLFLNFSIFVYTIYRVSFKLQNGPRRPSNEPPITVYLVLNMCIRLYQLWTSVHRVLNIGNQWCYIYRVILEYCVKSETHKKVLYVSDKM